MHYKPSAQSVTAKALKRTLLQCCILVLYCAARTICDAHCGNLTVSRCSHSRTCATAVLFACALSFAAAENTAHSLYYARPYESCSEL
jgi:hypothetical protein